MKQLRAVQRLVAACVMTLVIIGDACAQPQPRVAPATVSPAGACYRLSYSPDTVGYYLPALVELVPNDKPRSGFLEARWKGGDVQRPNVRESYKLSSGTAMWDQWHDSLRIQSHAGLHQMFIHVGRVEPASAPPASGSRGELISWKGYALAALDDGPDRVEGDVSLSKVSCEAFRTRR